MRKPAYCLNCDDGTLLKYGACDVTETIDGHSTLVHALCGSHCPACGEIEFGNHSGEAERYNTALTALRRQANNRAHLAQSNIC